MHCMKPGFLHLDLILHYEAGNRVDGGHGQHGICLVLVKPGDAYLAAFPIFRIVASNDVGSLRQLVPWACAWD